MYTYIYIYPLSTFEGKEVYPAFLGLCLVGGIKKVVFGRGQKRILLSNDPLYFFGGGPNMIVSFGARTQKCSGGWGKINFSRGHPQKSVLLSHLFSGCLWLNFREA